MTCPYGGQLTDLEQLLFDRNEINQKLHQLLRKCSWQYHCDTPENRWVYNKKWREQWLMAWTLDEAIQLQKNIDAFYAVTEGS